MDLGGLSLDELRKYPPAAQKEILALIDDISKAKKMDAAKDSFMGYIHYMWPGFIEGRHHVIIAEAFDRVIDGSCKRLIINMPPRFTKSEFSSKFLPSKYLGKYPDRKIIQTTHTADFSKSWGRKVRNLVATQKYQDLFPGTMLMADAKAAGKWDTSAGGEYNAIGVGGAIAGKGADLLIIDDPHTEQDYIAAKTGNAQSFEDVYEWYQTGPRQRLQPNAAIVVLMTRWSLKDLTGKLVRKMTQNPNSDQWEIIEFPAIINERSIWPEFWSTEALLATREELSVAQWNAQYLQNPTSEEGALVKRDWWRIWDKPHAPDCDYIIQSWDTAFEKKQTADYSACTTWGVFYLPDGSGKQQANIILLDAFRDRLEFPDLKRKALQLYNERKPDAFIVEKKASGAPLIYELRAMGIPVAEFTPTRGNDKNIRVNAVSDLFSSGIVWRPDKRWAEDVAEEFASFPNGDNDDYVDSSTCALLRFRQGGFVPINSDEEDQPFIKRTYSPY